MFEVGHTVQWHISPLLGTGEATLGVLCPVLDFPVQKIHGHTGKSPEKGH